MTCCPVGLLQLGADDDRADSLGLGMLLGMLWGLMGFWVTVGNSELLDLNWQCLASIPSPV